MICAVIVTYFPDRIRLTEQVGRLAIQADRLIIVDNGSPTEIVAWLKELADGHRGLLDLVELDVNLGIAAAQNVGMERAFSEGATRILLMDHDSLPEPGMVARLAATYDQLSRRGILVAAVGPRYLDSRQNNPPPFIRVCRGRLQRLQCPDSDTVNEVDYLIASGSLISREAFEAVGPMNEDLFIDYVDIEWGLRARARGYRSFGVCGAAMSHDLGEAPIVILGAAKPNHSVARHYFQFRNASWLYVHGDVPRGWKFVDGYRLLLRFGFYALFARPRRAHVFAMLRGLRDGVLGRLGPAPR